jgi:hypothetical protein
LNPSFLRSAALDIGKNPNGIEKPGSWPEEEKRHDQRILSVGYEDGH